MGRLHESHLANSILCQVLCRPFKAGSGPVNGRVMITNKEYAMEFPYFCAGNRGTFMNVRVIKKLLDTAKGKDIFPLDDIFMSGILRVTAGAGIAHL